jgi:hypothetical protein
VPDRKTIFWEEGIKDCKENRMKAVSKNLLLVGVDNSSLAHSVKKAGHKAYTVDYFGDHDVRRLSDGFISVIEQKPGASSGRLEESYSPESLLRVFESMIEHEHEFYGTLLSSGLDDSFNVLDKIDETCKIIGNSPETMRVVRDKTLFFRELEKTGVLHPETLVASSLDSAIEKAGDVGYPLVLKPSEGFAGAGVTKVNSEQQLVREYGSLCSGQKKEVVVQEYVQGTPASVSFMAAYPESKIVSLNEQLLGLEETHQPEPFGYCGNVTPYSANGHTLERCEEIVEKITNAFILVGSNGVDLVIPEDGTPYVIEVNPRFQGSLGCVERAYGVNLVKMHLAACGLRELGENPLRPSCFSTRLIIYAPRRVVAPDLVSRPYITDVPCPGSIIERGEPVCSIMSDGVTRDESLHRAQETATSIFNHVSN